MRTVAIIGSVGLPARYGGWETLADQLVGRLKHKYQFVVYCSSRVYERRLSSYGEAKLVYLPLKPNGVQSILYDIFSMLHAIVKSDYLLILGVSGCIALPIIKLISRKPVIVCIDGMEWSREKWGRMAKAFLKFSEKVAVGYADVVVTDNKAIQDYVVDVYARKSELIAYGGDHAEKVGSTNGYQEEAASYPFLNGDYAFTVCRIEPENHIHLLLESFSEINHPFVVVGNWDNSDYGRGLREKYLLYSNIYMLDPIYEQGRLSLLRNNCAVYVHGHGAGGTNPSLVEAMWLGRAIVAYDVVYNRVTTENKCKYFLSKNDLKRVINEIFADHVARKEIGLEMKKVANAKYSWDLIAQQYSILFGG